MNNSKTEQEVEKPEHGIPYYESDDGGSWWIELADGYTVDGCSSVHEKTKRAAITRLREAKKSE